jgi:hypothetical protein
LLFYGKYKDEYEKTAPIKQGINLVGAAETKRPRRDPRFDWPAANIAAGRSSSEPPHLRGEAFGFGLRPLPQVHAVDRIGDAIRVKNRIIPSPF